MGPPQQSPTKPPPNAAVPEQQRLSHEQVKANCQGKIVACRGTRDGYEHMYLSATINSSGSSM